MKLLIVQFSSTSFIPCIIIIPFLFLDTENTVKYINCVTNIIIIEKRYVAPVLNKTYRGVEGQIHVFLTLALVGGEWSASRNGRLTPGKGAPGMH
jgi:hypothetical protein